MKNSVFLALLLVSPLSAAVNSGAEMLAQACRSGDAKTVESFLASGVDPNVRDQYGRDPLYYAASFNRTEVVELLLVDHADPNAQIKIQKKSSTTPLQYAAMFGNMRMASLLITAGARVNEAGAAGRTALHFASGYRRLDLLAFLIDNGADVNARDFEGDSPLDDAVWSGALDTAALLLAHGARLNEAQPKTGATPINEAAFRGNVPLTSFLLQFHPDLTIADQHGHSPLQNAIRMNREDAALVLLEAEPKEQQTPHFLTEMTEAATKKDESILVENLLRRGASANDALPSGFTPLELAASSGAAKVTTVLLRDGADPNKAGRTGTTALESAALNGFDAIVRALLDNGAHPDELNGESGTTALYAAASFGKSSVVKLLLEHGANPNLCGRGRKTPYTAAEENGYPDLAAELRSHGANKSCAR